MDWQAWHLGVKVWKVVLACDLWMHEVFPWLSLCGLGIAWWLFCHR